MDDGIAHFAHLGGIVLGMLSIKNLYSNSNIVNVAARIGDKIVHFVSIIFRPSSTPKMKVNKSGGTRTQQYKSDEQFNLEKKERQRKTDIILDKISKSGYESLTKEEKDFLFRQSNNG